MSSNATFSPFILTLILFSVDGESFGVTALRQIDDPRVEEIRGAGGLQVKLLFISG